MITREMKRCNANKATAIDNDRSQSSEISCCLLPRTLYCSRPPKR